MKKGRKEKSKVEDSPIAEEPSGPLTAGQLLLMVREALGMSRKDVHRVTGVSVRTLEKWERGEREPGANAWLSVYSFLMNRAERRGLELPHIKNPAAVEGKLAEAFWGSIVFDTGARGDSYSGAYFRLKLHGLPRSYIATLLCDYCGDVKVHEVRSSGELLVLEACNCDEAKQKGASMSVQSIVPNWAKDEARRRQRLVKMRKDPKSTSKRNG